MPPSMSPEHNSTGRYGHEYYNELGFVPYNVGIHENVARTLEYAYDDWCMLQITYSGPWSASNSSLK